MTSSLYVRTAQKDGDSQAAMAQTIETQLKKSGIKIGSSITQQTIVSSNAGRVDFLIYFLLMMAIMAAAIGALGLMGMMSLNVFYIQFFAGIYFIRSAFELCNCAAGLFYLVGNCSWNCFRRQPVAGLPGHAHER